MALNAAQKNELRKLKARCLSHEGEPLDDAPTASLKRIEELMAKAAAPAKARTQKVRQHKLSEPGQELLDNGAEYLGCKKRGDAVDEYFYREGKSLAQEAVCVTGGVKVVEFGQTFSAELLAELSK